MQNENRSIQFGGTNQMQVTWTKCQGEVWCKLHFVNLDHEHFNNLEGVYVIWHGGQTPSTVYVGKGVIRDRLKFQRSNPAIKQFENLGLFVTWTSIPREQQDGVGIFLSQKLKPMVAEQFQSATPVEINSPW
jgi:hypothetical protein